MGRRRQSRELVAQFLYEADIVGRDSWKELLDDFWQSNNVPQDVKEYSNRIIELVMAKQPEIDKLIMQYTTNWDIARIAVVDRNILRASISELLYMEDIPPIVSINEAVDIAKKYGSEESGKFVNGILDKIRQEKTPERR